MVARVHGSEWIWLEHLKTIAAVQGSNGVAYVITFPVREQEGSKMFMEKNREVSFILT
jgi:hypothetical protein